MREPCERFDTGGQPAELYAGQGADDGLSGELLSPALHLPVPHDEIRVAEHAGYAEIMKSPVKPAVEHDRCVAKRVVRHGDWRSAQRVVHDFVRHQDAERVGARSRRFRPL